VTKHPERSDYYSTAGAVVVLLGILTGSLLAAIVAGRVLFWLASWWFDTFGGLGVLILGIVVAGLVWLVTWEKP
jgi:hypothetical protein